jgi:hypothetical protein
VVLVLAMGALAVGSPAFAGTVGVAVTSQFTPFNPGDTQSLKIRVTSSGPSSVTVSVTGLSNFTAQGCDPGGDSSCTVRFGANETSKDISFSVTATGSVDTGQSKTDHGTVIAQQPGGLLGGGSSAHATFDATLKGPQPAQPTQPTSVPEVSGVVRDMTTGSPIGSAMVVLVDAGRCGSDRSPCQVATANDGAFTFTSNPDKPIRPGTLQLRATKNGYDSSTVTVDARAGQPVNASLKLKPTAGASSSATPDALPSADGQQPTADAVTPTAVAAAPAAIGTSSPSPVSWLALALAGMFVLLGIGAVMVVLFLNRRKGRADGNPPPGTPGAPVVAASGAYGGAAGEDPTATIPHPRHPEDEFPDQYAAAYPAGPNGYAQAENGYDASPAYGQGDIVDEYGNEYGASSGYGGHPAGYDSDQSHGPGDGTPQYEDATPYLDGGADGGWAHAQHDDHEAAHGQQQRGSYHPYQ